MVSFVRSSGATEESRLCQRSAARAPRGDINYLEQVVGQSQTVGGQNHAFSWTPAGGIVDSSGCSPGTTSSFATGVNNAGVVIGVSATSSARAVAWVNGQIVELGSLGGVISWPEDVNNAGFVVGWSTTAAAQYRSTAWSGPWKDLAVDFGRRLWVLQGRSVWHQLHTVNPNSMVKRAISTATAWTTWSSTSVRATGCGYG